MKTLLTSLTLVAFAFALQAGEGPACDKNKAACADKAKATSCESACATKAKATSCESACATQCTGAKKLTKRPTDHSVKGATLLVRR
jgi:hypothetical protein